MSKVAIKVGETSGQGNGVAKYHLRVPQRRTASLPPNLTLETRSTTGGQ